MIPPPATAGNSQQRTAIRPARKGKPDGLINTGPDKPRKGEPREVMSENNQTKSNGRGGKRAGAGRKAGAATSKTREIADRAIADGITPLEFMLNVMRTEPGDIEDARLLADHQAMRFEAAKAAAPYIHPRLAAVEHTGAEGGPIAVTGVELHFVGASHDANS